MTNMPSFDHKFDPPEPIDPPDCPECGEPMTLGKGHGNWICYGWLAPDGNLADYGKMEDLIDAEIERRGKSIEEEDFFESKGYRLCMTKHHECPSKEGGNMKTDTANEWQHIGNVSVDGGLIRIGDPCYTIEKGETWKDICDFLDAEKFYEKEFVSENHSKDIPGKSVFVHSGYGDGFYPVFIKKDENGRVASVLIEFEEKEEKGEA